MCSRVAAVRGGDVTEVPRDRVKLSEGKRVLSPPYLAAPIYACGKIVNVLGFVPNAVLDVQVDGVTVAANVPGGFPSPGGAVVGLVGPRNSSASI
jgi:hypothetical protein